MANLRVLIVEDEYVTATALKSAINKMGYTPVGVATTAEEAVAIAREENPYIILMDIVLKNGSSGISAAEQIKKEMGIPVIYLTAYCSLDILNRAKLTEPAGYIVKPYTSKELRANIEMAYYKHQLKRKLNKNHAEVKILDGLIHICATCKKIRDREGSWKQVEVFIRDNSEAKFSHGVCPDCAEKMI